MKNRQRRLEKFVSRIERGEVEGVESEGDRIAAVRALGAVPEDVGPKVPPAVARGPVRMFATIAAYPKGASGFAFRPAGAFGRKTLQIADTFDLMAKAAAARGRPSPFTLTQIAMGRTYRALVERHDSAGVRGSSLETMADRGGKGGTGNSSFIDAVLRDRQAIRALRARMGDAPALSVAKIPKAKRGTRRSVPMRDMIDMICLWDASLSDVLRHYGWRVTGRNLSRLARVAGAALDRMAGPRGQSATAFTSDFSRSIWDAADSENGENEIREAG